MYGCIFPLTLFFVYVDGDGIDGQDGKDAVWSNRHEKCIPRSLCFKLIDVQRHLGVIDPYEAILKIKEYGDKKCAVYKHYDPNLMWMHSYLPIKDQIEYHDICERHPQYMYTKTEDVYVPGWSSEECDQFLVWKVGCKEVYHPSKWIKIFSILVSGGRGGNGGRAGCGGVNGYGG